MSRPKNPCGKVSTDLFDFLSYIFATVLVGFGGRNRAGDGITKGDRFLRVLMPNNVSSVQPALTKHLQRQGGQMGNGTSLHSVEPIQDDSRTSSSPSTLTADMHCVCIVLRFRITSLEQERPLKGGKKETQTWADNCAGCTDHT